MINKRAEDILLFMHLKNDACRQTKDAEKSHIDMKITDVMVLWESFLRAS